MIVFTSRKSNVNQIVRSLRKMGFEAEGIQSDMTQEERERALQGFKNKQYQILVATDILSRGIDIDSLSHVVNFDMPQDAEDYVHRVGRTARAASTGIAITFVNEKDMFRVQKVENLIERELPKLALPEDFGPAPVYDPKKRHDGRGGRTHRSNKPGSGAQRSDRRSKHHRRPDKKGEPAAAPQASAEAGTTESGSTKKRRNNRNRNRNRNRPKPQTGEQGQNPVS